MFYNEIYECSEAILMICDLQIWLLEGREILGPLFSWIKIWSEERADKIAYTV
jgi:hypothetical protein